MPPPEGLQELVSKYELHRLAYLRGGLNETETRREFIDPLFELLGWDIGNKAANASAYKDVVHEDSLKVAGATKAPDYSFRIGGTRKFFVEAKKPAIDIMKDPEPAFQLRRYAWSAQLPVSILTNFEDTAVYDCRVKPHELDIASHVRIARYKHSDLVQKWDEIEESFSRESILKGRFDVYAASNTGKAKKGTVEVDEAFLAEVEHWRDELSRNYRSQKRNTHREGTELRRTTDHRPHRFPSHL